MLGLSLGILPSQVRPQVCSRHIVMLAEGAVYAAGPASIQHWLTHLAAPWDTMYRCEDGRVKYRVCTTDHNISTKSMMIIMADKRKESCT